MLCAGSGFKGEKQRQKRNDPSSKKGLTERTHIEEADSEILFHQYHSVINDFPQVTWPNLLADYGRG
jgi:hypothetical protein